VSDGNPFGIDLATFPYELDLFGFAIEKIVI
jgi:hypothetical protein